MTIKNWINKHSLRPQDIKGKSDPIGSEAERSEARLKLLRRLPDGPFTRKQLNHLYLGDTSKLLKWLCSHGHINKIGFNTYIVSEKP